MESLTNRETQLRKYPRMVPSEDIYAVLGSDKNAVAKLCDISLGGISCKHLTTSENGYDYKSLDLFSLNNDEFHLTRIPCSVVYSVPLDNGLEMETAMTVKSRRIGVKFNGLSYQHENQLKLLMANSTCWN